MANYRAVSSGVWSALARWQDDSSGSYVASTVLPGAADVVYANNFTVTLDIDVVVSQLRTTSATNVNAGGLFDFGAANSVTANITAGTSTCLRNNTANLKTITGNATTTTSANAINNNSTGSIILNGNTTGGGATSNVSCINSSTGSFTVNGISTGGGGSNASGCWNNLTGVFTINGAVIGGSGGGAAVPADGIRNFGSGSVIINGNVTGGINSSGFGVFNEAGGTVTINGTSTGGTAIGTVNNAVGTINCTKVVASITAAGISNASGTAIITEAEDATNGRQACIGLVRYSNTIQPKHTITRQNGTQVLLTDNSVANYPSQSDVRNLVQYGPGNIYTGTLVPDITPQDIFTAIANSSDPIAVRLRNVATVQTTGDQIAAAL